MTARSAAGLAARLLAAALAFVGGAAALASGEPQKSVLYENFVRASKVLDRAVVAHGGPRLLDRTLDIRASLKTTLRLEGHYARPWAHRDHSLNGTWLYSASLGASKSELTAEADHAVVSFAIVGPANGLELSFGGDKPRPIPEQDLEDRLREDLELLPHEFLRQARAGAAGLRFLTRTGGYDVIHYTLGNGEGRALYFDSRRHLLMRVERLDHWELKGDRLEWRTFSAYTDRNGILVPMHSEAHREQESTQYDVVTEISRIELGADVKAEELTIPAAFWAGFETWTLQGAPPKTPDALLPIHDLGRGAYVIDLAPSDSRALLVSFSDFSVVVEAGDRSELAARLLRTAAHALPGKPVRYVAMTHHHPLYANGLRPYVQQGVTVLATAGNVSYYRDLVTRPYRIHPDEQQLHPGEPVFDVIEGKKIIEDGTQRLELYEFDSSTHTDEYVLPYLPSHKLIVTGDLFYVLHGDEPRPASTRERALARVVAERGLDVESIMQTWFLQRADAITPYARLEEKIRLAEAKDAAK